MSPNCSTTDQLVPTKRDSGFTLMELLVVISIIAILSAILLPALARTRARAQGIICLNNTKQLAIALITYSDDHNGRLAYNLGVGGTTTASVTPPPEMSVNWANNVLNWGLSSDNTNESVLVEGGLGPYLSRVAGTYRCPSDHVLSAEQQNAGWTARVRSYSMNAMVGDAGNFSQGGVNVNNPDYIQFFKYSSIPRASEIFIFLDEHPDSISNGYFLNKAYRPEWRRLPGSYHDGAACLSFADGHSEIHRWRFASTKAPSRPFAASFPIQIPKDERGDYYWLLSRMSVEHPDTEDAEYLAH